VSRKFITDSPLNTKLQSKKQDREWQKNGFMSLDGNMSALLIVRKFLSENILMPLNADGNVISIENVSVNVGAQMIMLAAEPETYEALSSIFLSPAKEDRRAHIDDKSLSFNEKCNALANDFMNAEDFAPENVWADDDSRINNVDPWLPPCPPWSGEDLRKHFHFLKTKFALVDEVFCQSGNLEAGADIAEADRFDGHIRRLLPEESPELHKLLLFAFWVFDKAPPKFISPSKPEDQQFDGSAITSKMQGKQAVVLLAPSEQEQKKNLELLKHQQIYEKGEEERKKF